MSFKSYSRVSSVRSGSPLITVSNSKCSARTTLICLEVRWVTWVRLYKCTYYIMLLLRHSGIRLALDDRRVHTSSIVDTYYATTIKPSGFRKCGWRTRPRRARPVPAISPYLENSYRGSMPGLSSDEQVSKVCSKFSYFLGRATHSFFRSKPDKRHL